MQIKGGGGGAFRGKTLVLQIFGGKGSKNMVDHLLSVSTVTLAFIISV